MRKNHATNDMCSIFAISEKQHEKSEWEPIRTTTWFVFANSLTYVYKSVRHFGCVFDMPWFQSRLSPFTLLLWV